MWYRVNTDDEHAMDGTRPRAGLTRGRTAPGGAVDDPATNEPADASSLQDRSTGGPTSSGFSIGDPDSDRTSPGGDQSVGDPGDDPDSGLPDGGPVDDGPAVDGGGVSPVVREYVEGLRREALARDAELRARGIDPYKGTGVDERPRRRLGARALAVLAVLVVAVVSVGAYVVFLRGEPDYGMSHGYQVQSDGSLKRPSTPVHQPDAPAELLRFTDDASEIAATHYFEVVAYAWNTGDTQYLRAFSSPDCQFCQKTADDIDRLYGGGGWASGAKFMDVVPHPLGRYSDIENYGEDTYGVRVSFHQLTPDLYAHNAFQASAERDDEVTILVHWDGQRWSVRELGRDQDGEGSN